MARLVTIYGGSGFIGRQIARQLAADGWRVRVAVRRPNQAGVVRTYGAVGQVEPVPCNVRDDLSVTAAMSDADAVINCVGIQVREGRNTFDAIHNEAAARIARISRELGVKQMVHFSALGADLESSSNFLASKAHGEHKVLAERPDAVILRPAVVFGSDDRFFNKLGRLARLGPIMPVPGANALVQPVYVKDVAKAAAMAADGKVAAGIYELGGPDVMTRRDAAKLVAKISDRRRAIIGVPAILGSVAGFGLDVVQVVTGGLLTNRVLTRDQVRQYKAHAHIADRPTGETTGTFADFGIEPTSAASVLPEYLWRFRPSGQYDAIKASARNLREN